MPLSLIIIWCSIKIILLSVGGHLFYFRNWLIFSWDVRQNCFKLIIQVIIIGYHGILVAIEWIEVTRPHLFAQSLIIHLSRRVLLSPGLFEEPTRCSYLTIVLWRLRFGDFLDHIDAAAVGFRILSAELTVWAKII